MSANRVSRACDGCRIRKVKCDGKQPCYQCLQFGVHCVVTPAKKRKTPIRGRLVAKVRGEDHEAAEDELIDRSTSLSESLASPTGYPSAFFTGLLPQFEEYVYPVNPILTSSDIASAISNLQNNIEDAALVYAFGAVTTFLAQPDNNISGTASTQVNDLMQLSLEARKHAEQADLRIGHNGYVIEESLASIKRVTTCIYLESAMFAFKRFNHSFALLREGITMLQTLKAHDITPQGAHGPTFQRLYWEAFIHERFLTMHSGYPSIMTPLRSLPEYDPSLPPHIEVGFNRLINLFRIVDRRFIAYRVNEETDDESIPPLDVYWVESRQAELDADERGTEQADIDLRINNHGGLTESQLVDMFVTRLWLRTVVWELALSRGLLSSRQITHEGLSLRFPAERLLTQLQTLVFDSKACRASVRRAAA